MRDLTVGEVLGAVRDLLGTRTRLDAMQQNISEVMQNIHEELH